jgi:multiple sugar transport system substrate-binding protein
MTGCLAPLDDLVGNLGGNAFVGPSLASYRYRDRLWALPVDAACQVAVARPDLLGRLGATAPRSWNETVALGARSKALGLRLAIALNGVHGLMTFFTLCASFGKPCGLTPEEPFVDPATGRAALDLLRGLLAFCPPEVFDWNSIALHDAMVAREDLVFCPAVYFYATYAEADMPRILRFFDLPGAAGEEPRGSTIGGTGIGLSSYSKEPAAAGAYVSYLMQPDTQKAFGAHHGQPARREAWEDAAIDQRYGGAFSATRKTIESAWIRPRYPGYLSFQARGGELVESHLRGGMSADRLLDRLALLHEAAGREAG